MNIFNFFKNLFKKKEENHGKGLIKSLTDYRDISLGSVKKEFAPLPETYKVPYILDIKDQGNKPTCVGETLSTIKEEKERREGNFINFDPEWIYNECKKIDGIPNVKGTYFRIGLKVLQKTGAMPVEGGDPSRYRIGGYIRIDCNIKSLKQAIYEFGAILVGFYGSNQGWKTAHIRKPLIGEKQWAHATAVAVGWDKDNIIAQNSWGDRWGDKGRFYFNKDYLPFSAWAVVTDLPNNWKELLGEDKDKPTYRFDNDLWRGLRNEEVKELQECLKFLGCFPDIKCTTFFGDITRKAVINFQKRYNIDPPYGYFGPLSRDKINELFL